MHPSTIVDRRRAASSLAFVILIAGCNGNPTEGSANYRTGELGNGGFLFACDDSVTCDHYSNSATTFPHQIASGANFRLRFVPTNDQGGSVDLDGPSYQGITIDPVGPFIGKGTMGFAALAPGIATFAAKNAKGSLIDYGTVRIVKPDAIAVVGATSVSESESSRIPRFNLHVGEAVDIVAVAEYEDELVAGAFNVAWSSRDDDVAAVDRRSRGVVTLSAKAPGKTVLTIEGSALSRDVDVEVIR